MQDDFKDETKRLKIITIFAVYSGKFEIFQHMDNKIGGKPYLPIGEPYPTGKNGEKLPLLFQVNLKNIDLEGYPQEGILEFFMGDDYPCEYKIKYFL